MSEFAPLLLYNLFSFYNNEQKVFVDESNNQSAF